MYPLKKKPCRVGVSQTNVGGLVYIGIELFQKFKGLGYILLGDSARFGTLRRINSGFTPRDFGDGFGAKFPHATPQNIVSEMMVVKITGWWFQIIFISIPILGEMIQFD